MSEFIALIVMLLVCFLYARIRKDHTVFTKLILGVFLGFVVGTVVKHASATTENSIKIENVSTPTLQSSSAVVWTDDTINAVLGQEKVESDTFSIKIECPNETIKTESLTKKEIQDDS